MPSSLEPLDVGIQIPYHFRCPISLELMRDPVTLTTGQTYDRSSIESWVATGNTTCPVTRSLLPDLSLIPNHTLRRLIQEWCVANVSSGVQRIPTPKQPANALTVQTILTQLSSDSFSLQSRISAIRQLRTLARDCDKNRSLIASLKASEILLRILFESSELSYESLATLPLFSLSESECLSVSSDANRITYLVSFLSHSSLDVRVNSAALIETVFSGTRSPELRSQFSNTDGIYEGIIGILKCPLAYPRALKFGIKALFSLCLNKQHRHKAVGAGAVETLIDRLTELERCDAERALATVELLCRLPVGCATFADHALTVPLLVKIILKISDRATEYAAGALLSVCSSSERCQKDAVTAGVLTQLLLLVQSDCTQRAKRKAQMLLKLLRDSWPEDRLSNNNNNTTDDVVCSQVFPF